LDDEDIEESEAAYPRVSSPSGTTSKFAWEASEPHASCATYRPNSDDVPQNYLVPIDRDLDMWAVRVKVSDIQIVSV